jgi:hypothetical protein
MTCSSSYVCLLQLLYGDGGRRTWQDSGAGGAAGPLSCAAAAVSCCSQSVCLLQLYMMCLLFLLKCCCCHDSGCQCLQPFRLRWLLRWQVTRPRPSLNFTVTFVGTDSTALRAGVG